MSSNNVTPLNFSATDDSPFSSEQLTWISEIELPKRVFLKRAERTDENTLTLGEDWRFYFSGREHYIGFKSSPIFSELGSIKVSLIKFVAVCYLREHSAANVPSLCYVLAHYFEKCERFSKATFLAHLEHLATNFDKVGDAKTFYNTLNSHRVSRH